ncbi:hypothetical protein CYMTET_17865, partial [Cymbomonas tetramitiformis]
LAFQGDTGHSGQGSASTGSEAKFVRSEPALMAQECAASEPAGTVERKSFVVKRVPKRGKNAWSLFLAANAHRKGDEFGNCTKTMWAMLGKEWRGLSAEEKCAFEEKARFHQQQQPLEAAPADAGIALC